MQNALHRIIRSRAAPLLWTCISPCSWLGLNDGPTRFFMQKQYTSTTSTQADLMWQLEIDTWVSGNLTWVFCFFSVFHISDLWVNEKSLSVPVSLRLPKWIPNTAKYLSRPEQQRVRSSSLNKRNIMSSALCLCLYKCVLVKFSDKAKQSMAWIPYLFFLQSSDKLYYGYTPWICLATLDFNAILSSYNYSFCVNFLKKPPFMGTCIWSWTKIVCIYGWLHFESFFCSFFHRMLNT